MYLDRRLPITSKVTTTMSPTGESARSFWPDRRLLDAFLLAGLAGVFLVNALVAVVQPSDFTGIVDRSLIGRTVPALSADWVAWVIGINDGAIGVCLVVALCARRARSFVLAWAGLWLLAVTVVKMTSMQAFGG